MIRCEGDGWHRVGPYRVLVEDRVITRCIKQDYNGSPVPAGICRNMRLPGSHQRCWTRTGKVTLNALRSGMRRGTMIIS